MPARRDAQLALDGLPALRFCYITFRHAQSDRHGAPLLSRDSFRAQRHRLQTLTLSGFGLHVHLADFSWCSSGLPALRNLAVRNLGLTDLEWLGSGANSPALAALTSLDLDDNDALQMNEAAQTALLRMTALQSLSFRKTDTDDESAIEAAPTKTVWTAESVRHIAKLAAKRPALQLSF